MATVRGCNLPAGRSCATNRSGRWVGPAKLAFDGEVSDANDAILADPMLANSDPYGAGWLVRVRPKDWAAAKAAPVPGTGVKVPYERKMADEQKLAADNFAGCP